MQKLDLNHKSLSPCVSDRPPLSYRSPRIQLGERRLFTGFCFDVVRNQPERDALLEEIHRLRFQVYVNEWGFEKVEDHPGGQERDKYDREAIHFYACTERQKKVIGTARIILPQRCALPIQEVFEVDDCLIEDSGCRAAEISRLAISKDFRRRAIDRVIFNNKESHSTELFQYQQSLKLIEKERRKCEHELIRGLYLQIYRESLRLNLTHWYAVMAKGLYIILRRWGVEFKQIGPEKDYHGLRAPYLLSIKELEQSLAVKNPELLKLAQES